MTPRQIVTGNIRARLAWLGVKVETLQSAMGWSRRTVYNKLHGITAISADELDAIARHLGLEDPGPLYRVPDSFPVPESVPGLLTWRYWQLPTLTWGFARDGMSGYAAAA